MALGSLISELSRDFRCFSKLWEMYRVVTWYLKVERQVTVKDMLVFCAILNAVLVVKSWYDNSMWLIMFSFLYQRVKQDQKSLDFLDSQSLKLHLVQNRRVQKVSRYLVQGAVTVQENVVFGARKGSIVVWYVVQNTFRYTQLFFVHGAIFMISYAFHHLFHKMAPPLHLCAEVLGCHFCGTIKKAR